jgi:uncharacterized protein YrrD
MMFVQFKENLMQKLNDFQGKLLISVTDGKNLGEVKDLYLDQKIGEVCAIYLGKTGLISRKTHFLPVDQIRLLGVDAWLVNGSDKVAIKDEVKEAESFILANDLRGRLIQTDGETKIGTIGDILVNSKLKVIGFTLDKIHVEGPLSEAKCIAQAAITSLGDSNTPMIAVLEQAERLKVEEV